MANLTDFLKSKLDGMSASLPYSFPWHRTEKTVCSIVGTQEREVMNACVVNCGSRCPLKCHVVDGKIRWITQEDNGATGKDHFSQHQVRACLRGRSAKHRVYSEDRLQYPMKRVGKRGEGKFERISWDEAIKTIADRLRHTIDTYGNDAIYYQYGTGTVGYNFNGERCCYRFLSTIGGYLGYHNTYSKGQIECALAYTYGEDYVDHRSLSTEISNAKLCVFFGYNPAQTRMSGGGEVYQIAERMRADGVRTIFIDPIYTDSMLGKEDEWIPIRPGTDAALVNAIAYILITEELVDQAFLDTHCIGYDAKTLPKSAPQNASYKDYILGRGPDKVTKTPQWAAEITGIPSDRIVRLAREIGQTDPVFFAQGWGPQRQVNGEQTARAICMLPILTGNIGLPGTNLGEEPGNYTYPVPLLPIPENKVKATIPCFLWTDAVTRGPEMTALADGIKGAEKLKNPIKFIWNYASNALINQHSDIKKTKEILEDESQCEFILVIDTHLTPSAKFADILLPDVTNFETRDIIENGYAVGEMGGPIYLSPVIDPMYECKSAWDVCTLLSKELGVEEAFTENKTLEEWLKEAHEHMRKSDPDLPDLKTARAMGMIKRNAPEETKVGLAGFRSDPKTHPLRTPSGKIEIYSEQLADIASTWELAEGDVITPLPEYTAAWESYEDRDTRKTFPLQLFGRHPKGRTHSTYHNVKVLRQAVTDNLWINPIDAKDRGIKDGDRVRIQSKRACTFIEAKITPRIMPGVVALEQGIWHKTDENGNDIVGSINSLTSQRPTALAKGNPQHTNLVEVTKA